MPAVLQARGMMAELDQVAEEGAEELPSRGRLASGRGEGGDDAGGELGEEFSEVDEVTIGDGVEEEQRVGGAAASRIGNDDGFEGEVTTPCCGERTHVSVACAQPALEPPPHRRAVVEEVALHDPPVEPLLGVAGVDHVAEEVVGEGAGFEVLDESGEVAVGGGEPGFGGEARHRLLDRAVLQRALGGAVLPDHELLGVELVPPGRRAGVDPGEDQGLGVRGEDGRDAGVQVSVVPGLGRDPAGRGEAVEMEVAGCREGDHRDSEVAEEGDLPPREGPGAVDQRRHLPALDRDHRRATAHLEGEFHEWIAGFSERRDSLGRAHMVPMCASGLLRGSPNAGTASGRPSGTRRSEGPHRVGRV